MTVLVGQQSSGASSDFFNSGGVGATAAFRFTAVASGQCARVWCNFKTALGAGTTGTVSLGVYTDTAGPLPNTLLGSGVVDIGTVGGNNLFSAPVSAAIVSGTVYWLAVALTGTAQANVLGTVTGTNKEAPTSVMPSPAGANFSSNMNVEIVIWAEDAGGFISTKPKLIYLRKNG